MKILMMMLLISCNPPKIKKQERCVLSFQFNKCRCHMYDLMKQKRVGKSYDLDIQYCEDLVGFHVETWAEEINPWAKESKRYYQDECK
jgi:hypothetical protein